MGMDVVEVQLQEFESLTLQLRAWHTLAIEQTMQGESVAPGIQAQILDLFRRTFVDDADNPSKIFNYIMYLIDALDTAHWSGPGGQGA